MRDRNMQWQINYKLIKIQISKILKCKTILTNCKKKKKEIKKNMKMTFQKLNKKWRKLYQIYQDKEKKTHNLR